MKPTNLPGRLEQKIINILWDASQPLTPTEVLATLGSGRAYTTIMTTLKRMVDKGLLKRKPQGRSYVYSPRISKQQFAKTRLGEHFDSLIGAYGALAISQFVDAIKGNQKDLEALEEYLDKSK